MILYPEKEETVTFKRCVLKKESDINWETDDHELGDVLFDNGGIEASDFPVQIDFANKNFHLSKLSVGATQEEIICATKPESFLGICVFDTMGERDCVVISDALSISRVSGFGKAFRWEEIRCENEITEEVDLVAIDSCIQSCYTKDNIIRDLNKAYLGFKSGRGRVSSGRWGCGVFNNDPALKFIQQVMAASVIETTLKLHWFDKKETEKFDALLKLMKKRQMRVKDVYKMIINANTKKFLESVENTTDGFKLY
ncbi:hypothetical protein EIN_246930 [Entamoeba invadens IP1]|uniref:PARG catalytic Macro domain-containing protein n=1 Tax=Entamoeba invadens IP1 TaxID=370355 RepID=A0A0A1UGD5_ENTIV|nr:hypothetical protein EIN_246930 [Entamoeba invadens IP1]ELP94799.1 hypothetical protein EIN_246930 [Entamoeba invadens IP1]|eukprot:XP_004261570.1 hypothetical protein EIN_246930 [Entamoeba invadens IP1]